MWGTPLERMAKELAVNTCARIKSTVFNLCS